MKIRRTFIFSVLIIMALAEAFSQKTSIKGRVTELGKPIETAVVLLTTDSENDIVSYTVTDKQGVFEFKKADLGRAKFLRVKMVGYVSQSVRLEKGKQSYDIYLDPKITKLKELVVKSPDIKMSKDTVTYFTSAFAHKNDVTISDVLKRMPGIEVLDNGHIKYQGQEISDFYVDGSDIMGGKYNMAVNSIRHSDVGRVEVLENHQSIKLFEDLIRSNDVALNLRLKNKAKDKWIGALQAGIGASPARWNVDAATMRFSDRFQSLNSLKTNNMGKSLSPMSSTSSVFSEVEDWGTPYNAVSAKYSPLGILSEDRTLFNNSHMLSLNSQFKIGKELTVTPQVELERANYKRTSYLKQSFFPEGRSWEVVTEENGRWNEWNAVPSVRIEANTKRYYLNNSLSAIFRKNTSNIFDQGTNVYENDAANKIRSGKNVLNMLVRVGRKTLGFNSITTFGRNPQTLLIDNQKKDERLNEQLRNSYIYTRNSMVQTFAFNRFSLRLTEGVMLARRTLNSKLEGLDLTNYNEAATNRNSYAALKAFAIPTISLDLASFFGSVSLPLNYIHFTAKDRIANTETGYYRWTAGPSVYARWMAGTHWDLSGSLSHEAVPRSPFDLYRSPIISEYPFLQTGVMEYTTDKRTAGRITLKYKDVMSGLFGNLSYLYQNTRNMLLPTQTFVEEYMISGLADCPHNVSSSNIIGNVSYMISPIRGGVSMKGVYSSFNTKFMQNESGDVASSDISNTKIEFNFFGKPLKQLQFNYTYSLAMLRYKQKNIDARKNRQFNQKLLLTILPANKFNVEIGADHYYEKKEGKGNNICLLDASLRWDLSSQWRFKLAVTNILNDKEFFNTMYSPTSVFEQRYELRPLTVELSVITSF